MRYYASSHARSSHQRAAFSCHPANPDRRQTGARTYHCAGRYTDGHREQRATTTGTFTAAAAAAGGGAATAGALDDGEGACGQRADGAAEATEGA